MPRKKLADLRPFQAMKVTIPIDLEDGTQVMCTVGIRVQLPHGEHFFYSTKHGSWTRHQPGVVNYASRMIAKPVEEVKTKYRNDIELKRRLGHAKKPFNLVETLINLRNKAA